MSAAVDIRLDEGFHDHPKTLALERALGAEAVLALQRLWIWTRKYRPRGRLHGVDERDLHRALRWRGRESLVAALERAGFLDRDEGNVLSCHNWTARQPYATGSDARSEAGRKAADARWEAERARDAKVVSHPAAHAPRSAIASAAPHAPLPLPEGSKPSASVLGRSSAHASASAAEGGVARQSGGVGEGNGARPRFPVDSDGFLCAKELRREWLDPSYPLPNESDGSGWLALRDRIEAARRAAGIAAPMPAKALSTARRAPPERGSGDFESSSKKSEPRSNGAKAR